MTVTIQNNSSVDNVKEYFAWFDTEFSAIIKQKAAEFWTTDIGVRLFSLEKNSKEFLIGNEYFVSQAEAENLIYALRLSENACEIFLTKSLGENDKSFFQLSDLTELEGFVLSRYNRSIFKELKNYFISKKQINKLIENEEDFRDYLHLGFVIDGKDNRFGTGKIFLSIPEKLIKFPELPKSEGVLDTTKFKKAQTLVDILVGKTRLSIDEINNIETEDIVVLENSNIKQMAITDPTRIDFAVNPDPRLFIKENNENTNMEDTEVSTKDIWDNVQVDVCAKFPKVKMSLGELREMSEGVVMELDSVYGNEVVLEVENRNVAKGELVIIGYKYGVKITEIFDQSDAEPETTVQEEVLQQSNNEDFDVKDFEIEE